ncbi:MAG: exodeoxyribonuclease III [Actinomycetota bacterium]
MRVISWNVNSIRSRAARLSALLERHEPDVVVLQETKCSDEVFAPLSAPWEAMGYEITHHGVNHWNGVAILSRVGLDDIAHGFPGENREPYDEPRLITATCGGIRFHNVYVPNGRELDDPHYLFKLVWLERLRTVHDPSRPTILLGDFNVAPADLDIYDPKRFRHTTHASPPERAAIQALLDTGLTDVTRRHLPGEGVYTFWNYRPGQFERNRGLRIDLALCSADAAEIVTAVAIDTDERTPTNTGEKPSDHAPLVLDLAPVSSIG